MRKEQEIAERLKNYLDNYRMIHSPEGKKNVDFAISELRWVLGRDGK